MVRICPKRDIVCPYGMDCPYAIDRYQCKEESEISHAKNVLKEYQNLGGISLNDLQSEVETKR